MPFDEIAEKIEKEEKEKEYLRTGLRGDRGHIWPTDPSPSEIGLTGYMPKEKDQ